MTLQKAILAGGCFWGMEDLFRSRPGVTTTRVGYTGGHFRNPTYRDLTTGETGHAEAIEITFDDTQTDYQEILKFFFQIHDPTTPGRQGNDRGSQYRSAIFTMSGDQQWLAEDLIREMDASGKWPEKIVTEIAEAGIFYEAEAAHQAYLQKHPDGYTCHWVRPGWSLDNGTAHPVPAK